MSVDCCVFVVPVPQLELELLLQAYSVAASRPTCQYLDVRLVARDRGECRDVKVG